MQKCFFTKQNNPHSLSSTHLRDSVEYLCLIHYLLVQDRDLNWEKLLSGDWEMWVQTPSWRGKQGICLPQIHMSSTWSCKTKGTQGKKSMSVYHCDYFFSLITWQIQSISVTYQAETVFSSEVSVYWINCCINYFWWHDADGIIVFVGINIFNIIELILLKSKKPQHFVIVAKCSNDSKVN